MSFPRLRSSWLLAIGTALVVSLPTRADEYRNESRHFTLNFPGTWSPILKDAMTKMNAIAAQASGPKIQYITGFQRRGQPPMSPPYVLVQVTPNQRSSYEDIEKDLARECKMEVKALSNDKDPLRSLIKDASLGTPVVDRATNRVFIRIEGSVPGVGKIQGLSVGFIGSKDMIFLHCYALDSEFDNYMPVFQGLIDSFQWDNGFAFTPGKGSSVLGGFSGGGALRGALIGGIIGALVAIPVWFWHKWQKAQKPRSGNFAPVPSGPPPAQVTPPAAPETGITGQPGAG